MNYIQNRINKNVRVRVTGGHVIAPFSGVYIKAFKDHLGNLYAKVLPNGRNGGIVAIPAEFVIILKD